LRSLRPARDKFILVNAAASFFNLYSDFSFCSLCAGYESWRELAKVLADPNVPGGDLSLPFYYSQKVGHQVRTL